MLCEASNLDLNILLDSGGVFREITTKKDKFVIDEHLQIFKLADSS